MNSLENFIFNDPISGKCMIDTLERGEAYVKSNRFWKEDDKRLI